MSRRILTFAKWLAVLIAGVVLIEFLTFSMASAGSGAGTGVFSYWFRARFRLDHASESGRTIFGPVNVEGRVDPQFRMWGHQSPRYHEVEMDWLLSGDGGNEGQAIIDLDRMQMTRTGRTVALTAETVAGFTGIPNADENGKAINTALVRFLESARDGTLPPPGHHGHSLPEPLPGRMQHFASGPSLHPFQVMWIMAWSLAGLARLWRRQHVSTGETERVSRKPGPGRE